MVKSNNLAKAGSFKNSRLKPKLADAILPLAITT
jgi:hypothetical protein